MPEDPFLETYLVRPGGATVFGLMPDERVTVIDREGGQVAELTSSRRTDVTTRTHSVRSRTGLRRW